MIENICPEEKCTGCFACMNVCPTECIRIISDDEGFFRPEIITENCNGCSACIKVCPMLNLSKPNPFIVPKVYACWNIDDEIRFESASGGVFTALAHTVLKNNGVVFGAAFDKKMYLKHISVSRFEELGVLRSSKYVQSYIGNCFGEIRRILKQGKRVLFSGTPCQVHALKTYLRKEYELFFTCDMLCHGVPSPGLFAQYIAQLQKQFKGKLVNINMRHKLKGWKKLFYTVALLRDGQECVLTGLSDSFMHGFLSGISLRPSCYLCPYTNTDRYGDITLADFWGIGDLVPFHHDTRKGVSLILVNSEKGKKLFEQSVCQMFFEERSLEEAVYKRPKLTHPFPRPQIREAFFSDYQQIEYEKLARRYLVDKGMKGFIKQIVPKEWIFKLHNMIRK
ncbi:MAG: Coenzyme F420 hydrogenase/dehydrogenase, beta subunit C-terminal domain [Desulfobacteraceae bacterium]